MRRLAAYWGLFTVGLLLVTFAVCVQLNPGFDLLDDYLSQLGARQQPWALLWNVMGFAAVGVSFALFGIALGRVYGDGLLGCCLGLAGLGFALAATPTDLANSEATLSKIHFASVCIGLAGWCLALARVGGRRSSQSPAVERTGSRPTESNLAAESTGESPDQFSIVCSNVAAVLAVLPMLGVAVGWVPEPMAHRWVLGTVCLWTVLISVRLLVARSDTASS